MTQDQIQKVNALIKCTFQPGSYAKRFVRDVYSLALREPTRELSEKQADYLDKLLHMYRKQIPVSHRKLCAACSPLHDE